MQFFAKECSAFSKIVTNFRVEKALKQNHDIFRRNWRHLMIMFASTDPAFNHAIEFFWGD